MTYQALVRFGSKVRAARIKQQWAPAELARRMDMSVETLFMIERGQLDVSVMHAQQLSRILRIPIHELL